MPCSWRISAEARKLTPLWPPARQQLGRDDLARPGAEVSVGLSGRVLMVTSGSYGMCTSFVIRFAAFAQPSRGFLRFVGQLAEGNAPLIQVPIRRCEQQ